MALLCTSFDIMHDQYAWFLIQANVIFVLWLYAFLVLMWSE